MSNGFDTSVEFLENNVEETEIPGKFTIYFCTSVNTFKVLSDRKVLVGGYFYSYNDVPCYGIARLHVYNCTCKNTSKSTCKKHMI